MELVLLRYLHFNCIFIDWVIGLDISKWHCEDLTLAFQSDIVRIWPWHFKVTSWGFDLDISKWHCEDLTLTFQSDIVRIWAQIKVSPFYYKANGLTNWDLHPYPPLSICHTYPGVPLAITCPLTVSQNVYEIRDVSFCLKEIGRRITKSNFRVLKKLYQALFVCKKLVADDDAYLRWGWSKFIFFV